MKDHKELHDIAMDLYETGLLLKETYNEQYRKIMRISAYIEFDSALKLKDRYDVEPTRSVLFLSAANIYLYDLGDLLWAENSIIHAKQGTLTKDIEEEIKKVENDIQKLKKEREINIDEFLDNLEK